MTTTSEEYAKTGGGMCPFCGNGNLDGYSVEIETGKAWQRVDCNDCEKSWTDIYKLTSYEEIEP